MNFSAQHSKRVSGQDLQEKIRDQLLNLYRQCHYNPQAVLNAWDQQKSPHYLSAFNVRMAAEFLFNEGKKAQAMALCGAGMLRFGNDPILGTYAAFLALRNSDYETAENLLAPAIRQQPHHYALTLMAQVQEHAQQFDAAIASLKHALELKPDYAFALDRLGIVYLRNKQPEQAIAVANNMLHIDPVHLNAFTIKTIALIKLGKITEAFECADQAIDIAEREPEKYRINHQLQSRYRPLLLLQREMTPYNQELRCHYGENLNFLASEKLLGPHYEQYEISSDIPPTTEQLANVSVDYFLKLTGLAIPYFHSQKARGAAR